MGLNGIMSNALSALMTNTEALRITSNNIANINTPGYARRTIQEGTFATGGMLNGVDIETVRRAIDTYLNREVTTAGGTSARYDAQTSMYSQLDGMLGSPGDDTALTSQLSNVSAALGQATLAPGDNASQLGALNAFQSLATQMVPAQAVLDQTLNSKMAHKGEQFRAKLTDTVHLKNGTELPRGTSLVGTVAADNMQHYGGKSVLALRFTQAQMKNGKTIPIEATIIGVAPPATTDSWDYSAGGAPPDPWNGKAMQIDEVGVMSGVDLHSRIAGENSGVFVSTKKDNMKLAAQSQMSLAITSQSSGGSSGGF